MLAPPPLPRKLEAALRDVSSKKPEIRASAAEDLVRHARTDEDVRKKALPMFVKLLSDEHPGVRSAAAVALGDLHAKENVDDLLKAVDDEDLHVRQMVLNALGEIGDPRALPCIEKGLSDRRPDVRYQSVIALGRAGASAEAIEQAIFSATSDDDDAIVHIAFRLAEERLDQGHALSARMITRAKALLEKGSPHVQLVAAILLAKAGDDAARTTIAKVVRGEKLGGVAPEKEDEDAAVEVTGALGMKELIPTLERRAFGLKRWVANTSSFHAKIALARMGHARAKKDILDGLDSVRWQVRSASVVSAGRARIVEAKTKIESIEGVDPTLVEEALDLLQ